MRSAILILILITSLGGASVSADVAALPRSLSVVGFSMRLVLISPSLKKVFGGAVIKIIAVVWVVVFVFNITFFSEYNFVIDELLLLLTTSTPK